MSKPISDEEKGLLTIVVSVGRWHVDANRIVSIGRLIERGWIGAVDDCEGPRLFPTEAGIKAAQRLGLVKFSEPEDRYLTDWDQTEKGLRVSASI